MKKSLFYIILAIAIVVGLTGCSKNTSSKDNGDNEKTEFQVFEADVIEAGDGLLVGPDKDSPEYSSADKISVGLSDAGEIPETLKPGDRIKIYYYGNIAESYPAKISASRIELIGSNQIVDGIISLIDDIYHEDSGLNNSITMMAFDTGKLEGLSDTEIEIILAMAREEYGLEIVQGTFDELAEQGLIDKENLYFEKGILIEFKDVKIDRGKNKISCSISKWRSGLGAIGWDAKAELDGGEWIIKRDNIWIS